MTDRMAFLTSRISRVRGSGLLLTWLAAGLLVPSASSAANPTWMLEAKIRGQRVEGLPVGWTSDQVHLLARDGRLLDFHRFCQRSS